MQPLLGAIALSLSLALALGATPATAHEPALHGLRLVEFERPFPAPDFELATLAGGTLGLAALRGRHVLLNFWATWCPPCLEEMPSMDVAYRRLRERGFTVVAVSSDHEGASIVQSFVDRLGVTFPILLDPDERVSMRYGAKNLPVSFLLDPQGRVVAAAQGARDWASEEALTYLEERIAGR